MNNELVFQCPQCGARQGLYEWSDEVYVECWTCAIINRLVKANLSKDVKTDVKI